jgi:UDP-glucose 4-epimerase
MRVLVCGGAGYIGSHLVRELHKQHQVVVFDNLSTGILLPPVNIIIIPTIAGHSSVLPDNVPFVKGDIRDRLALDAVFKQHHPDAVMHFCASIVVPESCSDPLKYYENNVSGTINLLQAMRAHETKVNYYIGGL